MADRSTDYTRWEHQDLIQRVHELEQQLREHTRQAQPSVNGSAKETKTRKASKAFDTTRYNTRKIALKFAYLGGAYNGLEHHANNKTPLPAVEEILWRALMKTKLIFPQHKPDQSQDEVCWDGCDYSKCGRTDKGVSAFGQVVSLRVRSSRPLPRKHDMEEDTIEDNATNVVEEVATNFDPVLNELPYIQLLNKVLPPDVRVLGWCSDLPNGFDARFSCRERRYRYFFTNPAYMPHPEGGPRSDGWLDVEEMQKAAQKYIGLHDFRNFCKIDPSKQITNFERRIFSAGIHAVDEGQVSSASVPKLYFFEVRGSAFLWHQVRHLVAVLFLIGQGLEKASLVDELLDIAKTPSKPLYEMADDAPLVLWDCVFPTAESTSDHAYNARTYSYEDSLPWVYAGDAASGLGKYGARGIMDGLWSFWRERKVDEVLANQLIDVVARQSPSGEVAASAPVSIRVFEGGDGPRRVGPYTPVLQRARMDSAEVQNTRYAARKALSSSA